MRWADLNMVHSILTQGDISEGVDAMHQKIDTCIAVYNVTFLLLICLAVLIVVGLDRCESAENWCSVIENKFSLRNVIAPSFEKICNAYMKHYLSIAVTPTSTHLTACRVMKKSKRYYIILQR
jgi:hypothetical protein